jgi:hypothetical protein
MIIQRIQRAITRLKLRRRHLPQSAMGKAIDYTLTMWPMLTVYLEDGRIEIDNNPVENAIRPTAVGKKNWLFIGEAEAGQRSAILFTIIEACRSSGIAPQTYLRDVLTRLPTLTWPAPGSGTDHKCSSSVLGLLMLCSSLTLSNAAQGVARSGV